MTRFLVSCLALLLFALPAAATEPEWTNSLGMQFVRVPNTNVLFCVWETRVQDYQEFVKATGRMWSKPEFAQTPKHPAVRVNWEDAVAFCQWLSEKEKSSTLHRYRLPTSDEWSLAAGLQGEADPLTKQMNFDNATGYPWEGDWPPPKNAGNYAQELGIDSFSYTAPVGSFPANKLGIFDLGGNVWEWCMDSYNNSPNYRVLRGASYKLKAPSDLAAAFKVGNTSDLRLDTYGFRCVIELEK